MAKQKTKRKRGQGISRQTSTKSVMRSYEQQVRESCDIAENTELAKSYLGVSDVQFLRNIEADLDPVSRDALRTWTFGCLSRLRNNLGTIRQARCTQSLVNNDRDAVRSTFVGSLSVAIADIISDEPAQLLKTPDVFQLIGAIEHSLPENFHEETVEAQCDKHIFCMSADSIASGITAIVDWDQVFEKNDVMDWCANAEDLMRKILAPEKMEQLDKGCAEVLETFVKSATDRLPHHLNTARRDLDDMGYFIEGYTFKPEPPSILRRQEPLPLAVMTSRIPAPTPYLHGMPPIRQPMPAFPPDPDREPVRPWMESFLTFAEFLPLHEAVRISSSTLIHPFSQVVYTAIHLGACCHKKHVSTCMAESLLTAMLSQRLVNETLVKALTPDDDTEDPILEYLPYRIVKRGEEVSRRVKDAEKAFKDSGKDPEGMDIGGVSLYQLITNVTDVLPPSRLLIRSKYLPILKDMGLKENEAWAMCGWLEAMQTGRRHTLMTNVYIRALIGSDDDEEQQPEDTFAPENYKAELDAQFATMCSDVKKQAQAEIDAEKRRHLKFQRSAQHEANVLEARIQELERQLDAEKDENRRLQSVVNSLSDPEPEESDDTPDIEEAETGLTFPCNVGENMKVLVYGGPANWIAAMSQRFPHVRFLGLTLPNEDTIYNADIVFVNTFVMKHKRWWPIQNACIKYGKRMEYFPSSGINKCSEHLAKLCAEAEQEGVRS